MKVDFLDVGSSYKELDNEIDDAISSILKSGQYILGEQVESFENNWASYCGARFAVGVSNGLDALILSLKALEIGVGDEVIVPSNTFIATWLAVSNVGAKIVPIEPDSETLNIDCSKIESKISSKTKAIIPVHLYGNPANMNSINNIAKKYDLFVIEDAAQAHGAEYNNKRIGSHGHLICWSFYPGKNLGAFGDAGAITTNDFFLDQKLRLLRNYGSKCKYEHSILGLNTRLDPIQAAILNVKLKYLDQWNFRRAEIADRYLNQLKNSSKFSFISKSEFALSSWHLFVILTEDRDLLMNKLKDKGIQTSIHYPIPPGSQKAYSSYNLRCEKSESLSSRLLSLPIGPHLPMKYVDYIIENLLLNS